MAIAEDERLLLANFTANIQHHRQRRSLQQGRSLLLADAFGCQRNIVSNEVGQCYATIQKKCKCSQIYFPKYPNNIKTGKGDVNRKLQK